MARHSACPAWDSLNGMCMLIIDRSETKQVSERLAAHVAVAFIAKAKRPIGKLKLGKLLYLAEREAMRRFLLPIIGDDVFAMREGMALSKTVDLVSGNSEADGEWNKRIVRTAQGLGVRKGVSLASLDLSEDDLDVIESVWERYGHKSKDELVNTIHHELPEWIEHWNDTDHKSHAVPVPYETLYRMVCGVNDGDARYLAEDYRAAQERWITSDPEILGGTPVVVGTRISVYAIRGRLMGGETPEDLAEDYPGVDCGAFRAASMFAKAHPLETHPSGKPWATAAGHPYG